MMPCFRMLLVVSLLAVTPAYSNGWASGQNFVPAIEEAVVTDEKGNQLTIPPGTPVYLKAVDGPLETWLVWKERPRERRIQISRAALPEVLTGFRAYQRSEFALSTKLLEAEAKAESNALVRSWKYILAGHSHLLEDFTNTDKAVALYRRVAKESSSPFQADAQYFVFRVLLNQKKYDTAQDEFEALTHLLKDDVLPQNLLFRTYPQNGPLTAWGSLKSVDIEKAEEAGEMLGSFIAAKSAFDSLEEVESDSERAEIYFQLAVAMEELWRVLPEQIFDNTQPPDVPKMLELTFETYPKTDAAAKAYYRHLYYEQTWDFTGEEVVWARDQKEFMERFLARYPNSSPAPEARKRRDEANRKIEQLSGN